MVTEALYRHTIQTHGLEATQRRLRMRIEECKNRIRHYLSVEPYDTLDIRIDGMAIYHGADLTDKLHEQASTLREMYRLLTEIHE